MSLADWASLATVIQGVVATVTLPAIVWQLLQSHKAQRAQAFMNVVTLDTCIVSAGHELLKACAEPPKSLPTGVASEEPTAALANGSEADDDSLTAYEEQRFNLIDRLCSGVVHGFIDESVHKVDYLQMVLKVAAQVRGDTDYPHIHEVAAAWRQGKPARRRWWRRRAFI